MIKLYFKVEPIAKARPRVTRTGHCYTPKKTKDFEETIKQLAVLQMHELGHKPLTGILSVRGYFFLKKPKKSKYEYPLKDIDNLMKSVFDALNGIAWIDDAQICHCAFLKTYSKYPSITLFIHEGIQKI